MTLNVSFFTHTLAMIDHALSAALHSLHSRDQGVDALFQFVDAGVGEVEDPERTGNEEPRV